MNKNILLLVLGLIFAISFTYIKTTYGVQTKTTQIKGLLNLEKSTLSIPDNGISSVPVNTTFTPLTSFVEISCLDPDECNITLDDSTGLSGDHVSFIGSTFSVANSQIITSLGGAEALESDGRGAETIHDGTNWHILQ